MQDPFFVGLGYYSTVTTTFEGEVLAVTIETTKNETILKSLGMVQPASPHVNGAPGMAADERGRPDGFEGPLLDLTVLGLNSGTSMVSIPVSPALFVENGVLTMSR